MLQLKITQKVQKELGLKPANLSEITQTHSTLGDWVVNMFYLDRRKSLIFVNEKTLFSFVLYGVKKSNISKLPDIFLNGLEQALVFEAIDAPQVERVLNEYREITFTKTDNKKVLGNMNDLIFLYKDIVECRGGLSECDFTEVIMRVNRTPQRNIDWRYSIEALKELLGVSVGEA